MKIRISTYSNRHSSVLPGRRFRASAGVGFLKSRSLSRRERRPPTQPGSELQRELQKVRDLVAELHARLERSEQRVDGSLERIGLTLNDLSSQREQIRALERNLGIER